MAAKSGLAAKLADKSPTYKIGLLAGVIAFVGFAYWQVFYSSLSDELGNLKSSYTRLERENKSLKQREREWEEMVKGKEEIDRMLAKNQVSLPAHADLASFIGHLQRQAAAAGVTFKSWRSVDEKKAGQYVKVPVAVDVSGTFFELMKYMKLLYETKRITTVENFRLDLPDDNSATDEVVLEAKFLATTFRQPDGAVRTEVAPAPAPQQKGGMIQDAKAARDEHQQRVDGAVEQADEAESGGAASGIDRLANPGAEGN